MSVTLLMAPLATGVIVSGTSTLMSVRLFLKEHSQNKALNTQGFDTEYRDLLTLRKALLNCNAEVKVIAGDCLVAKCCGGTIMYKKHPQLDNIQMYIVSLDDMQEFEQDLADLQDEYGLNVQEFTYNRIKSQLPEGMHLERETVLDDDTIQLTLYIDE